MSDFFSEYGEDQVGKDCDEPSVRRMSWWYLILLLKWLLCMIVSRRPETAPVILLRLYDVEKILKSDEIL